MNTAILLLDDLFQYDFLLFHLFSLFLMFFFVRFTMFFLLFPFLFLSFLLICLCFYFLSCDFLLSFFPLYISTLPPYDFSCFYQYDSSTSFIISSSSSLSDFFSIFILHYAESSLFTFSFLFYLSSSYFFYAVLCFIVCWFFFCRLQFVHLFLIYL